MNKQLRILLLTLMGILALGVCVVALWYYRDRVYMRYVVWSERAKLQRIVSELGSDHSSGSGIVDAIESLRAHRGPCVSLRVLSGISVAKDSKEYYQIVVPLGELFEPALEAACYDSILFAIDQNAGDSSVVQYFLRDVYYHPDSISKSPALQSHVRNWVMNGPSPEVVSRAIEVIVLLQNGKDVGLLVEVFWRHSKTDEEFSVMRGVISALCEYGELGRSALRSIRDALRSQLSSESRAHDLVKLVEETVYNKNGASYQEVFPGSTGRESEMLHE